MSGPLLRSKQHSLFDHLVGAGEQGRWHVEAERLGRSQIDDKLEFGWLLDRDVTWARSAQNSVYKVCGSPV